MPKNAFSAVAPPRTPLGELPAHPQTPSDGEGDYCPIPKNSTPALGYVPRFSAHDSVRPSKLQFLATAMQTLHNW